PRLLRTQKTVSGNSCIDKTSCRTEIRSPNRSDSVDGTVVHPMSHTLDNVNRACRQLIPRRRNSCVIDSYDATPNLRKHHLRFRTALSFGGSTTELIHGSLPFTS